MGNRWFKKVAWFLGERLLGMAEDVDVAHAYTLEAGVLPRCGSSATPSSGRGLNYHLNEHNPITDNVKRYIDIAGFGGVIDSGYQICMSDIRSCQSECFLIYWDVVEFHTPQRVMRQFGMVQRIPDSISLSFNEHMKWHSISRSGKPEKSWKNSHNFMCSLNDKGIGSGMR
ncbi:hypothetical protein E3N88_14695 [Mikania micrantha]|uniref:Aminotransferase-like plant mobile domain-containing protein n=1 Tax=Mikania micrantha TaxID=192012 RepID=A0A5N6P577_9ASTR|nr:hypothetical protein E3N88_14695 [Mikania micrantha]